MKLKYTVFAIILIVLLGLLVFAGTVDLKNEFFSAASLLDADDLKLFDGVYTHDKISKYDFEIKDGDYSIAYTLYTEDFKTYFLESRDNFDFVIRLDENAYELDVPWSTVKYFQNCKSYNRRYSSIYDGIIDVLRKNTDEDDFSSRTSIIDYNGLSRQNNAVTLEMKDISAFMEDVKEYLSSDDMAKMLNALYGADCTSEKLHSIIEETLNVKSGSLQYKRSIVADTAHEETISLGIDDNVFDVRITNKSANDAFEGSLIVSDKKKTVDFSLILAKNDEGEIVTLRNGSIFTEVMAKDKSSITYLNKNGSYEMKMTFSTLPDAKFGENIYDATASSQKNRMLCELSPWLTSNGNAALLFKTYEVGLKPISFNLEDLKINFDE